MSSENNTKTTTSSNNNSDNNNNNNNSSSSSSSSDDEEESDTLRKLRLEARLIEGCGHGRRKTECVEFFWKTMWPMLETLGWSKVCLLSFL